VLSLLLLLWRLALAAAPQSQPFNAAVLPRYPWI
jgi:hypothetical protein